VVTEQVLDTGRAVQVAERLEEDNPDWVIIYGSYSREFVAFPVYPDAPDNSYCSAKDAAALDNHIRETERRHGRVRLTAGRTVHIARAAAGFCIRKCRGGAAHVNTVTSPECAGSGLAAILGPASAGPGQTSFLG
jgi:hypothetical protein